MREREGLCIGLCRVHGLFTGCGSEWFCGVKIK